MQPTSTHEPKCVATQLTSYATLKLMHYPTAGSIQADMVSKYKSLRCNGTNARNPYRKLTIRKTSMCMLKGAPAAKLLHAFCSPNVEELTWRR